MLLGFLISLNSFAFQIPNATHQHPFLHIGQSVFGHKDTDVAIQYSSVLLLCLFPLSLVYIYKGPTNIPVCNLYSSKNQECAQINLHTLLYKQYRLSVF